MNLKLDTSGTKYADKLPAGTLPMLARKAIIQAMHRYYPHLSPPALDDEEVWAGNSVATRFLTWSRKTHDFRLSDSSLDPMISIATRSALCARDESGNRLFQWSGDVLFDFDATLMWSKGDFGDSGSCYFSTRGHAWKNLRDMGRRAMRFYDPLLPNRGIARAFIAELPGILIIHNEKGGLVLGTMAEALRRHVKAPYMQTGYAVGNWESQGNAYQAFWIGTKKAISRFDTNLFNLDDYLDYQRREEKKKTEPELPLAAAA